MDNINTAEKCGKGMKWLVVVLIIILIAGGIVSYLYYSSQSKVINLLQLNALQMQRLEEFGRLSAQVSEFNNRFGQRFGKIRTLESIPVIISDIEKIQAAEGIPDELDSLIIDFKVTTEKVQYLGDQIEDIEHQLGTPHIVKANETHSAIVLDYLTKEAGLSKAEAEKLMKNTALIWELEPGNHVLNLYWNKIFLTTVTQGEAKRSPLLVQQRIRQTNSQRIEELEMRLNELSPADSVSVPAVNVR